MNNYINIIQVIATLESVSVLDNVIRNSNLECNVNVFDKPLSDHRIFSIKVNLMWDTKKRKKTYVKKRFIDQHLFKTSLIQETSAKKSVMRVMIHR